MKGPVYSLNITPIMGFYLGLFRNFQSSCSDHFFFFNFVPALGLRKLCAFLRVIFMFSGPCMTLVISKSGEAVGDGLIPEFRSLIGPKDVNVAKEEAPER